MSSFSFSLLRLPFTGYKARSSSSPCAFCSSPLFPSAPTVFYPLQWPGPALPLTSSWGMKVSTFLSITPSFTCSRQLHVGSLIAKKQVFYLLSSKWPYPTLWRRGVLLQLPAGYRESHLWLAEDSPCREWFSWENFSEKILGIQ